MLEDLELFHLSLLPEYTNIDKGSGRCRVSKDFTKKYPQACIGQVARIHVDIGNEQFDLLCSIWPDTYNQLQSNQISIDSTVCSRSIGNWLTARGKIISILTPKVGASVRYSIRSKFENAERGITMPCNTLPLLSGFIIDYQNHIIAIGATNPPVTCVPNYMTIWVKEQVPPQKYTPSSLSKRQNPIVARTKVVAELIDKLVLPVLRDAPIATRYKGLMLLGPPGVGKSFAVQAVQELCKDQLDIRIVNVSIPELLAEEDPLTRLKQLLPATSSTTKIRLKQQEKERLTLYLVDEIDALGSGHIPSETHIAIKATLCAYLDHHATDQHSAVIATSNRSEDIDPQLLRGGRLEHAINVLITTKDRFELIASYLPAVTPYLITSTVESRDYEYFVQEIAERTGGYVAADIASLFAEVHRELLDQRIPPSSLTLLSLQIVIFEAMRRVPPSCLRGVRISQPNLSLKDVIGCEEAKLRLKQALSFTDPKHAAKLRRFNIAHNLGGVLLNGPPGNSKTRLVAAVASEYHLPLIALAAADVYSAYVGDAEAEIRKAFTLARQAAPCVLFFDEIDSLVTNRNHDDGNTQAVESRVLSTFLNEMDGVCGTASAMGVVVMAATNRLDCIDAALLRKGRFNQTVFVPLPNADERMQLLQYFSRQTAWPEGESFIPEIIERLRPLLREGMSGAEVEALCKEEALKQMEIVLSQVQQQASAVERSSLV